MKVVYQYLPWWTRQVAAQTFKETIVNNPEQSLLLRTQLDTLNNYLLNYT